MEETPALHSIDGTVDAVIFQNEENGYTVLRLEVGAPEPVTVVGCIPGVAPGEGLTVTGTWGRHASYGEQFKAESVERRVPAGEKAMLEYLSSGILKGVGAATARRLVEEFGADLFTVLEEQPELLTKIKGITRKRALEIGASFRLQMGMRRLLDFLSANGLPLQLGMPLYRRYGVQALEVLRDNPYLLVDEELGVGFSAADQLALRLGMEGDDPQRLEAGLLFELSHNLMNGHTFLPRRKLLWATGALIGLEDAEPLEDALATLVERGEVVRESIAGEDACYLAPMQEAEEYVAFRLAEMAAHELLPPAGLDGLIGRIEAEQGITYAPQQRQAVDLAARSQVMLLTGGPGTGKTTSIRAILALFDVLKLDTQLAAPTGRAAKRMSELTGRSAQTIHRLLEAGMSDDHQDITFRRDEDDPLECDAVILDECSMVDISLMCALLRAMRPECRLILVGDADQLPSVGPGNVFSDIIRSGVVPTVRLTEIFRQAAGSSIVSYAHAINRGEHPNLAQNSGDFFFLRRTDPQKAADTVVELCRTRLPNNMKIPPSDIQVLTPTRKYDTGMAALNVRLQAALNPPSPEKKERRFGETVFREGDRVMQIRNDYDIVLKNPDGTTAGTGVYNGDVGQITAIDPQTETLAVCYDGKTATYGFEMLNELEHAWVMTVHKSQGSEYRAVVLCIGRAGPMLLTRSVLYTAITRAKSLLIIVGDEGAAYHMIDNQTQTRRYSGLRARLCGECGAI